MQHQTADNSRPCSELFTAHMRHLDSNKAAHASVGIYFFFLSADSDRKVLTLDCWGGVASSAHHKSRAASRYLQQPVSHTNVRWLADTQHTTGVPMCCLLCEMWPLGRPSSTTNAPQAH